MSALDFTARALAISSAQAAPALFAEMPAKRIPREVHRIDSAGFDASGHGSGTYLSDDKCTDALITAHPLATFADAGGRKFRLAGDAAGFITPEQLGCPAYSPGTDQRPWIQAAIEYAEAAGLNGVALPQPEYELWAPPRTGAFVDHTNHTGSFLVIHGQIALFGQHVLRATLRCKGPTGGSLATDYQVMNSPEYGGEVIWRGHGIKIVGTENSGSPRLPESELAQVALRDIVLYSDARGVQNVSWPAYPPSRDPARENCWDISNKGINYQANVQTGTVRAENVDIIGFLGEAVYTAHTAQGAFIARNLAVRHTNAQALNPNGPNLFDIDGLIAENCGMSIEGWCGHELGRIVNAHFRNCLRGNLAAGSKWVPPRRADGSFPTLIVDAVYERCGNVYIGPGVTGRLTLIDSRLAMVPQNDTQIVENVSLDVTVIADQLSNVQALTFGPHAGSPPQSVRNIDIRVRCLRTAAAREAGRTVYDLIIQSGSLGPDIKVRASGQVARIGQIYGSSMPDSTVALIDEGLVITTGGGAQLFQPQAGGVPNFAYGWLRFSTTQAGTEGSFRVEMPDHAKFNDGAEVIIEHRDDLSPAAFLELGDIALLGYRDRLKLRVDRRFSHWTIIERSADIVRSSSITLPELAIGEEAGPFKIPFPGALPRHRVSVSAPTGQEGLVVVDPMVEADQVVFYVCNRRGADPRPTGDITFTARLRAAQG